MSQAQIEATVAAAWRVTMKAARLAEAHRHQGCADDLHAIATELRRVQESLLRGPRGVTPHQTVFFP